MPVRLCVVVSLLSCLCVYFPLSSYLSFSRCRMFTDICRKVQGLQVSFTRQWPWWFPSWHCPYGDAVGTVCVNKTKPTWHDTPAHSNYLLSCTCGTAFKLFFSKKMCIKKNFRGIAYFVRRNFSWRDLQRLSHLSIILIEEGLVSSRW